MTIKDDYVEMEMDALNQHECMASLTALLQHMARNNITEPPPEKVSKFRKHFTVIFVLRGHSDGRPPCWAVDQILGFSSTS